MGREAGGLGLVQPLQVVLSHATHIPHRGLSFHFQDEGVLALKL